MSDRENKKARKLNAYVGEIIYGTTVIENALAWRIRTYFFPESNTRASVFHQNVLSAPYFNFDRKIDLFRQVPYFKKLKNYQKILASLRYVQKLRNAVAHFDVAEESDSSDEIIIFNPDTFKKTKLNQRLIEEFIEHDIFLLKSLSWKYSLARKYGIPYKEKDFPPTNRDPEIRAMARFLSKYFKAD